MPDKQLNVWIPEELRDYVARRAEKERRGMNSIIAEFIQQDMAQHNDKIVGQNSLIALREIVSAEIRQAHAQLRHDLRDDRQHEAESFFEFLRKQTDRLAGLIIMAIRNGSIARRLSYTVLSKAYGPSFAKIAYNDADEKAHQELLPKKAVSEHITSDKDEKL